jgi:hypothetical protein
VSALAIHGKGTLLAVRVPFFGVKRDLTCLPLKLRFGILFAAIVDNILYDVRIKPPYIDGRREGA